MSQKKMQKDHTIPSLNSYERFITRARLKEIQEFVKGKQTPFLVIDLPRVGRLHDALQESLRHAKIYYAVKANPENAIVELLHARGSYFDVASRYEIDQLLKLGVSPTRMSYGNTIKKAKDVAYAFKKGIRNFATDALSDLENLALYAPGSLVNFRLLLPEGGKADWPLSRKFGADSEMVLELVIEAAQKGLVPYALSFHVGSQQRDIREWDKALKLCKILFDRLEKKGITLKALNLGGGFPSTYIQNIPETREYGEKIKLYLEKYFGTKKLDIILEPGRSVAGDAGIIFSEVVLVSQKKKNFEERWVYLDIGKFGGLIETLEESIKYPIFIEGKEDEREKGDVILAGPTCDSADIMYEKCKYRLPNSLKEGDRALIMSTGAYTSSYSSVNFNGFPPLKVYVLKK